MRAIPSKNLQSNPFGNYSTILCLLHKTALRRYDTANERMQLLTRQMAEKQHMDEALKECDQLAWVGAKNNIHHAAEEIVLNELIYN